MNFVALHEGDPLARVGIDLYPLSTLIVSFRLDRVGQPLVIVTVTLVYEAIP
ncbi:hypothetical protein Sinac_1157 [Singulisphaera acidiphila DSM 18658]|uniref:Uncharacterized protein n=1 Tax=Singulisphaera acidiphila (strain ATCC BAA-1392 / DSM 18658 / VKM B-2454 / MOB10) TaxID=886293 RepID=L0D9P4_SINAD|nr:hypothetical protein Sinac_1157 [Singulisphaera acidiphila DSM 18658]